MGAESLEDPVGDPALETPERLLGRLAFLLLLQVVGATWWMTRDLGESGEVDDAVQLPVTAPVQAMPLHAAGARG